MQYAILSQKIKNKGSFQNKTIVDKFIDTKLIKFLKNKSSKQDQQNTKLL